MREQLLENIKNSNMQLEQLNEQIKEARQNRVESVIYFSFHSRTLQQQFNHGPIAFTGRKERKAKASCRNEAEFGRVERENYLISAKRTSENEEYWYDPLSHSSCNFAPSDNVSTVEQNRAICKDSITSWTGNSHPDFLTHLVEMLNAHCLDNIFAVKDFFKTARPDLTDAQFFEYFGLDPEFDYIE